MRVLKGDVAAAFDPRNGTIYLKKNATLYEASHEGAHAKQWSKLGKEKYNDQTRIQKEQFVFDELMKNKELLTLEQINHAEAYIFKVKNGYWPPFDSNLNLYILN